MSFYNFLSTLKWTPNLGQVFKWDTVQRNGLPMTESKKRRLHPPELKAKLANFKIPKRCFVVAELPRNTMGKVQKNLLREQYKTLFVKA